MIDVYPASSIKSEQPKRKRRTKAELAQLRESLFEIVQENQPMTVRQLFYQMVSRKLIEKTETEYNNTVIRLCTEMRRSRELPYSWLADNTRWMRKPNSHDSLKQFLTEQQSLYRRDLWQDQDCYVEVWLEKDALSGVLIESTRPWDVPLMVTRGYPSLSFLHSAAENIEAIEKPTWLYYFGDCDPSGRDIPRSIESNLRQMLPHHEIYFELVAVTDEQIERYKLPTRPTKATDSRAKNFKGESVEVDAIPPKELIRICDQYIERHVDSERLERHRKIESLERLTLSCLSADLT